MEIDRMARTIYGMCMDMDCQDYAETAEMEIKKIMCELNLIKEINCSLLVSALETIAMQHEYLSYYGTEC